MATINTKPSQADWQTTFVYQPTGIMGITTDVLPDTSSVLDLAYQSAAAEVLVALSCVPGPIYLQAVYNLASSNLINWAMDLPGAPGIDPLHPVSPTNLPYFTFLRKQFNTYGYVSGTIQSASDVSTSDSMVVPLAAETFTLSDLQRAKDPYGRTYLMIAQKWGTYWGIT